MEKKAPPIELTTIAKPMFPRVQAEFCRDAFDQVAEFGAAGHGPGEAGSVVAHCLLRTAWLVAGTGALLDGRQPNPERFIKAAQTTVEGCGVFRPSDAEPSWRDHVEPGEHHTVLAEYDDGSAICLSGYAGGGAPGGAWSSMTLMRIDAQGETTFREFVSSDPDWHKNLHHGENQ
ncbi:hypothetical protein [Labrenzia sp. DG1229]|uniref:hypothetical protein n=1 Tax=Labrenzia sp. DG1229 TaxID=681847 RepID=UPI00048E86B1|nr:hypothetical protein [Labrenzia sp. DG1229]